MHSATREHNNNIGMCYDRDTLLKRHGKQMTGGGALPYSEDFGKAPRPEMTVRTYSSTIALMNGRQRVVLVSSIAPVYIYQYPVHMQG
jgi:hypothetical protein